ncbi:hypothetical protein EQ832_18855 [Pseudomonas sp. ALS1131]|nr:hypothetical protein [Pseudomonas sp. ALS1131]TRO35131.1 hypothetical protein EQ832_18855 [Pseudomonas sp. ALS1131]
MRTFYVLTRHNVDGSRAVAEIYYYDDKDEIQIDLAATSICGELTVWDDNSLDAWIQLQNKIAARLESAGIIFAEILFD